MPLPRLRSIVLLVATLLTSCKTDGSDLAPPVLQVICPAIRSYDPVTQKQAARELQKLPRGSVVAEMIGDYGDLRDQVRACRK